MSIPAISAYGLRKKYGDTLALDGFDLVVAGGTIHGLLGPNGAGKSTAVKALTTLIDLDGGDATVAGHDIRTERTHVRERIGLIGQSAAVDEILGGRQNLVMFGRLFGLSTRAARRRADDLLETFDLAQVADRSVATYSGGMRRRLDLAAGLILAPAVLFLDEPTTGLDPRARGDVWDIVRDIAAAGTTVLLTTQYLDEADRLASAISVMDHGKVIAEGTPEELKRRVGGDRVTVTIPRTWALTETAGLIGADSDLPPATLDVDTHSMTFEVDAGSGGLSALVRALDSANLIPDDLVLRRPSLDEVYLQLTSTGVRP